MWSRRATRRLGLWVAGGIWVCSFAIAGVLALTGDQLAALKLALFAMLLPGLGLFALWGLGSLRQSSMLDRAAGVTASLGVVLFLVALLVWLPFSHMRWRVDEMPLALRVPLLAGLVLSVIGFFAVAISLVREFWRRGDYVSVGVLIAMFGLVVGVSVVNWLGRG